jgi:uncharacterized RDD family membrane protein YckC
MFCTQCGNALSDGAKFCSACGAPIGFQSEADDAPDGEVPAVASHYAEPTQKSGDLLIYASFWKRAAAYVIDIVLLVIVMVLFLALTVDVDHIDDGLLMLIRLFLVTLYFTLMESSSAHATFGKQILGLKVLQEDGQGLHFGKALLRNLARQVSALIFLMGYVMMLWTQKSQTLHDKIAQSIVVEK